MQPTSADHKGSTAARAVWQRQGTTGAQFRPTTHKPTNHTQTGCYFSSCKSSPAQMSPRCNHSLQAAPCCQSHQSCSHCCAGAGLLNAHGDGHVSVVESRHKKYSGTVRFTSVIPEPLGGAWSNCIHGKCMQEGQAFSSRHTHTLLPSYVLE